MRIRIGQMIVNEKIKKGEFKIPIHLALGHEAIAVAVDSIMRTEDQLVLSHRNIHYNLARIRSLKPQLDEYLLRKDGPAEGRLGSMNLANEKKNVIYASSILGNNFAVASGLALGQKVKRVKGVVIVVGGDGAIEEGSFYESMVFLKSNQLSSLVLIENNGWSLATRIKERRCDIDLQELSKSLNIRYAKLKGNDPYQYIEKLRMLRKYVLDNKAPLLLEVELATLGSWYLKTEECPGGKFVNYHSGPAPTINLSDGPRTENSVRDPVFVLEKYFEKNFLETTSQEILKNLKDEIR